MSSPATPYLFALTNPGAERALRDEVAVAEPAWRLSYQQRGFVTFKAPEAIPFLLTDLEDAPAFARRLCLSLGREETAEAARALLEAKAGNILRHELKLERGRPVRTADPERAPQTGELVGTVVELREKEFWAGLHRHGMLISPDPGGCGALTLPEDSPSRAWLKLEEAVRFFGLRFTAKDVAVELGCAPGGVLLALLRRGVSCIGVDPARLAPVVMASAVPAVPEESPAPWVFHCQKPAALVSKRDLAGRATWFLSDMNQSPEVAIKECGRFIRMCPSIRSALITLKLTDLTEASAMPQWRQALRAQGFTTVKVQQLSVHHRELALLGLRRQDV